MKFTLASAGLATLASTEMKMIKLRNGVEIPAVVVGTFQQNSSVAERSVRDAIKAGFTGTHTDYTYFNQDGVARALAEAFADGLDRKGFFIPGGVAGCGLYDKSDCVKPHLGDCDSQTRCMIEANLASLGVDYLDMVIVHHPPNPIMQYGTCSGDAGAGEAPASLCEDARTQWKVMEEYYKAGKLRSIGVSNYCPSCYDCLKDAEEFPHLNQIHLQVGWGVDPLGSVSCGTERGVVTQAYDPLGVSINSTEILHGELMNGIAAAHNKSTAQVALKWLTDQNIPAAVKSTNPKHLAEDVDLFDWELTEEETKALNEWDYAPAPFYKFISMACRVWPGGPQGPTEQSLEV